MAVYIRNTVRDKNTPANVGTITRLLCHGSNFSRPRRLVLYLGVLLTLLCSIWAPTALFVLLKPNTYTSNWALILPGSGTGHAVSLDSVGQATSTSSSPYNSSSIDPKVNYKALVESQTVLQAAADSLKMTLKRFGKPRIKLVDQTALMDFQVHGDTPEEANEKSFALYYSLQDELTRLRRDELKQREDGIHEMLGGFSDKLLKAQTQIVDYQAGALIISLQQFSELTLSLQSRRGRFSDLKAELAGIEQQILALSQTLSTNPMMATLLLELQQDALFAELAREWATASVLLTKNRIRWGNKHHQVVSSKEETWALRSALIGRARKLAPSIDLAIDKLIVQGTAEPILYRRLVELYTNKIGLRAELSSLEQSITDQQVLLANSTTDAARLGDLKHRHQVATAVFTTALAKADIGKYDLFSSYPMLQLLAEPTLPEKPDTLGKNLAFLGASASSLISLIGLILLWIRKPFFQKILKNA